MKNIILYGNKRTLAPFVYFSFLVVMSIICYGLATFENSYWAHNKIDHIVLSIMIGLSVFVGIIVYSAFIELIVRHLVLFFWVSLSLWCGVAMFLALLSANNEYFVGYTIAAMLYGVFQVILGIRLKL